MTDFKGGGIPTPDLDKDDINFISEKTEFYDDVFVYGKLYADLGGDVQTFSTAGVERVRITKEGDVAIGSENPNVVVESSNTSILAVGIVTAREYYGTFKGSIDPSVANDKISEGNSEAEVIDSGTNGFFKVTTEGVERFRIDSSGNVGIGTNVVSDSTGNSKAFTIARSDVNGQVRLIIKNQATGFGNGAGFHQGIDGANAFIENRTNGGYIDFTTNNSGTIAARMRITSDGAVQINSDGGSANFSVGASQDFKLYHDANGPTIFSDTNNQGLKLSIKELDITEYTGNTSRLKITSAGVIEIDRGSSSGEAIDIKTTATSNATRIRFVESGTVKGELTYSHSNDQIELIGGTGQKVSIFTDNSETLTIGTDKVSVFNGDIHLSGQNTATNQNRAIYWTGFDKETVGDVTDNAMIRYTTNVHGISGSVLEIKTENDANDGIALHASSGNGQIALVGKKIDVSGYIEPSYGAGDNGIKWATDPSGGSGDVAHIQYYQDGSGENTRLRILIANDADDDLRLEGGIIRAQGSFSKLSGSFRVPHVLAGLTTTTDLVHSFVEGPQADNLYRGRTKLVAGISTVNIDTINNMTEGTFVNLNRDVQCFTTNETGWTAVKGSVTNNLLTITAQDNTCTDTISWMVIGERWDLAMYDPKNPMTDANGKVKTEIPNDSYNKGGSYEQDYISENRFRVGISTISRPAIENKEV